MIAHWSNSVYFKITCKCGSFFWHLTDDIFLSWKEKNDVCFKQKSVEGEDPKT